jgi:hypothetical protein
MVVESQKEVSWSATQEEITQEMVEKQKFLIKCEILATWSVIKVLKDTFTMLKLTDPCFLIVSKEDTSIVIKAAADFDQFLAQ